MMIRVTVTPFYPIQLAGIKEDVNDVMPRRGALSSRTVLTRFTLGESSHRHHCKKDLNGWLAIWY